MAASKNVTELSRSGKMAGRQIGQDKKMDGDDTVFQLEYPVELTVVQECE